MTYLKLTNDGLVEIFSAFVYTHSNKESSVHMLLAHTPLSLLLPSNPFLLQTSSLSFLTCLPAQFRLSGLLGARRPRRSEAS